MSKEKHDERPNLDKKISVEDFLEFYWLKEELQNFCREEAMSASGSKIEITERIAYYLKTGHRLRVSRPSSNPKRSPYYPTKSASTMSLNTVIEPGFKCTQEHREFFKSVIGTKFHFSVELQNFIKANAGKTYNDVVDHYYKIQEDKKNGRRTTISRQFEYNTFIRDYYDDPANNGKSLKEAISAWKEVRSQRGDNVYRPKK
ncbi:MULTISPECIES: DUF6434 domain-containing protein [Peribacillus]|uniref:DUF6434 domain-containing protein n=1 Tax=Peribacillus TaxID=2675229 RepID=UPI001F4E360F|nr:MULTISPECIES: DUF6434 domain-containing protein [unclassified Peribacillus]MCK1984249.1 SAP domain-containing protein [Peribacillus sp. Aquil_B1]MCK2008419.1 SAP domain-containing protein [Peribacillus sp. Aquil_B8]